ncbi:MAG: hypothetical protein EBU82_15175 [Flavobacteriia bacterium]|nr:hypothetical protein [Flavobacteriia bacterium]
MKIISHRGNLHGPNPACENVPSVIDDVLAKGFDCEVDLWVSSNGDLLLGHDFGAYKIDLDWLSSRILMLWIHCKNLKALEELTYSNVGFNFFWHQEDDHVMTSKQVIWSFPGQEISSKAVAVLPELWNPSPNPDMLKKSFGVCTDYPLKFDRLLNVGNH